MSLSFQELLFLLVELLGFGDDLLLLLGETLINFTLLALFLQKSDGLKGPLTLDYEGTDASEVLVGDLGLRVLAHVLVDAVEELVDLALLVNVHL